MLFDLVLEILTRIPFNPIFFAGTIHKQEAKAALAYQNAHADKWGLTR
jgi:hypothetical protein